MSCASEKGMNNHTVLVLQQYCHVSPCNVPQQFPWLLRTSKPIILVYWSYKPPTISSFFRVVSSKWLKCGSSPTTSLHPLSWWQSRCHQGRQGGAMEYWQWLWIFQTLLCLRVFTSKAKTSYSLLHKCDPELRCVKVSGHSPDHSKVPVQDLSLSLRQSSPSLAFIPDLFSRIISSEPVWSPSPLRLSLKPLNQPCQAMGLESICPN